MNNPPAWLHSKNIRITGEIEMVQGMPDGRLRIILKNIAQADNPDLYLPGKVNFTWDNPPFTPLSGQNLAITRQIRPYTGFTNDRYDSFRTSLAAKNILWQMWSKGDAGNPAVSGTPSFPASLRHKLKAKFLKQLSSNPDESLPQGKAILMALIFGDRQYLSQQTVNNFASGALAHSLALSGQHLGIAVLLSVLLIYVINKIYTSLFLYRPRKILIALFSIPMACLYLWLGNAPPSLVRAAAMLIIASIWLWRGKLYTGIDILALAILIIILLNPLAVFDIGLELSAICVFIIFLTVPLFKQFKFIYPPYTSSRIKRFTTYALRLLFLSFILQLFLLPLNLSWFQNPGYWFPLNLVWLPVLGLLILPASFLGLLLSIIPVDFINSIASWILSFAAIPCDGMLKLLNFLASQNLFKFQAFLLPHWTTLPAFALLPAAITLLLQNSASSRQLTKYLLSLSILMLAIGPFFRVFDYLTDNITITVFDVGQAQAIGVQFPGGINLLIDGGGSGSKRFDPGKALVAPQLLYNKTPALSAVINSHPDLDHAGGLFHFLDTFPVKTFFHNGQPAKGMIKTPWFIQQRKSIARVLKAGDIIYIGKDKNTWLEVLWPPENPDTPIEGNNASLLLRLVKNNKGIALFCGDIEKAGLQKVIGSGKNIESMLVMAPHHGSDKNLLSSFYKAARPEIVAISCGSWNRFHYPGKKLQALLAKLDIPYADTGESGKITVTIGPELNMVYKTVKPITQ